MDSKGFSKKIADLRGMIDGTYVPPPRPSFDHRNSALYGGLARASLHCQAVELLPGLELRRSYAYVFAPAMVAFAPPPAPRSAHPAPWHAADGGGIAETVEVEVFLAADARPFALDRLDTVRCVASLIRLLGGAPVCMPILSSQPFNAVPNSKLDTTILSLETVPNWSGRSVSITPDFVERLRHFLGSASVLLQDDDVFRAFSLADGMWWLPSWTAQMLALWTAAETLMRPGRTSVGAKLADSIRSYLGLNRSDGDRLYNEVTRLYFSRGSAAHAGRTPVAADMDASYRIVRGILLRCFADGQRPPERTDIVPLWK